MSILPNQVAATHVLVAALIPDIGTTVRRASYIDPAATQDIGVAYSGVFVSQSMNREDKNYKYSLTVFKLFYTALADTTVDIAFSPDGGLTWPISRIVNLTATTGNRMRIAVIGNLMLTGTDLRFRITFNTTVPVLILKWRPRLAKRSPAQYA